MAAALPVGAAAQQPGPKPVRLVIFSSGGPLDFATRQLANKLGPILGTSVVVEPKPGANGVVAAQTVAAAEPDGSTLLVTTSGLLTITPNFGKPPYDPDRDLTPVSRMVVNASALVVDGSVPASNIKEFVDWAKSRREPVSFGSPGIGNIGHLWLENFNAVAGTDIVHVPYKGAAGIVQDLLGGRIAGTIIDTSAIQVHLKSGRMKALGTVGGQRHPMMPDVPTMREQGYGIVDAVSWYGIFAPVKTPPAAVARMSDAIHRALQDPEVRERLRENGSEAAPLPPDQFARLIQSDRAIWARLIREKNIVAE
ncbi:MAG: tripartite tricarboxylate transporter substrate binding protein [Lautropia sp.]